MWGVRSQESGHKTFRSINDKASERERRPAEGDLGTESFIKTGVNASEIKLLGL